MHTARTSPASFLKHAATVASFYGFRPVREIERGLAGQSINRKPYSFASTAALLGAQFAASPTQPVLAFYATPTPTDLPARSGLQTGTPLREMGEFGIQVVGSSESVGEVLVLKTLAAIVKEWGSTLARVRINAQGDRDSQQRFSRELALYLRKQGSALEESCRARANENPLLAYYCTHESCQGVREAAPRAMSFLSEKSRAHFSSVLEQMENLSLPYELDDLLADATREPHLLFALDLEGEDATLLAAAGGRFDEFLRRQSGRRESAVVAASIYFRKKGASRASWSNMTHLKAPKIYFVQLGSRAKLQGLAVLDLLRAAGIPVSQSFDAAHLSPQLVAARELGVSHMLIMGQREALDGTIIIRSTANSSQQIVAVSQLPRFLKTLR